MAANNLINTKAELISSFVQKELLEKASLVPFVTDLSSLAMKGYNSISIPKLSSFTVSDRAFGAEGADNAPLTDSKDTILLDQNRIVKWSYDAADAMQSSIEYQTEAAGRAAAAHGRDVSAKIIAMWADVAGLSVNGAVPADISIDAILDMREYLIANFADMSNVALILGADQEKAMLKLPEFSRYDYRGNGASPIINGMLGTVYGVPVYVTQFVPAQQAFMVEKSGSAIAFQRSAKYGEQPNLDLGTDGVKAVVDQTFGLGGLQIAEGSAAAGKSPFIAKLKD